MCVYACPGGSVVEAMGEITVIRPDLQDVPRDALELAARIQLSGRPTIGLIANGKPLARELLEALGAEVSRSLGLKVDTHLLRKPNAAHPITAAEADGMAARAHIVITGVGD